MNIEIANRLVQLRKSNNLSQEALAEKLGISRQAVSKWERAEASPDTDNLILLARLYGVSLDELLKTEDEIPEPRDKFYEETEVWGDGVDLGGRTYGTDNKSTGFEGEDPAYESSGDDDEYVHVGFRGIHVKDKDGEVHVGWDGIHVDDRKKNDSVHIDKKGVYVNGEKYDKHIFSHHKHFPIALIVIVTYIVIGSVWKAWHPGWLIVFLIPIWESLLEAIEKRDAAKFAYPVLMVLIYLCLGIFAFLWHPGWVVFLTVPVYYSLIDYCKDRIRRKKAGSSGEAYGENNVFADEEKAGDLNEGN